MDGWERAAAARACMAHHLQLQPPMPPPLRLHPMRACETMHSPCRRPPRRACCSWELPWAATNPWQIVAVVIGSGRLSLPATLPGPESMPADLQGQYVALMKRCWAQAAADRPPMQQVAEELR